MTATLTDPQLSDAVMDIIIKLEEFCRTKQMQTIADARKQISVLASNNIAVADTLWKIAIQLQRELFDLDGPGE